MFPETKKCAWCAHKMQESHEISIKLKKAVVWSTDTEFFTHYVFLDVHTMLSEDLHITEKSMFGLSCRHESRRKIYSRGPS